MKVKINKLPEGYKEKDGSVIELAEGGSTGNQKDFGLVTIGELRDSNTNGDTTKKSDPSVSKSLNPVPRDEANIEAEKGETVLTDMNNDGEFELYDITGKRHKDGGTPLDLPPQSFVYSDTRELLMKKDEMEEMGIKSKKKLTPAKISKDFPLNKYYQILAKESSQNDPIATETAEYMLNKNKLKLSHLAFLQEYKKDFEDGVPLAAFPYLQEVKGLDPVQYSAEVQDISQREAEAQAMMQMPVDVQEKIKDLKKIIENATKQNPEERQHNEPMPPEMTAQQMQAFPQASPQGMSPEGMMPPQEMIPAQGIPPMPAQQPMMAQGPVPEQPMMSQGGSLPKAQTGGNKEIALAAWNSLSEEEKNAFFEMSRFEREQYVRGLDLPTDMARYHFGTAGQNYINERKDANNPYKQNRINAKKEETFLKDNYGGIPHRSFIPLYEHYINNGYTYNPTIKQFTKDTKGDGYIDDRVNLRDFSKQELGTQKGKFLRPLNIDVFDESKVNFPLQSTSNVSSPANDFIDTNNDGVVDDITDNANDVNNDEVDDNTNNVAPYPFATTKPPKNNPTGNENSNTYDITRSPYYDVESSVYSGYDFSPTADIGKPGVPSKQGFIKDGQYYENEELANTGYDMPGWFANNKNVFASIDSNGDGIPDFGDDPSATFDYQNPDHMKTYQTGHQSYYTNLYKTNPDIQSQYTLDEWLNKMSFTSEPGQANSIDGMYGEWSNSRGDMTARLSDDQIVEEEPNSVTDPCVGKEAEKAACQGIWNDQDCTCQEGPGQIGKTAAPPDPEFWIQDQLGIINAVSNRFRIKRRYPWAPKLEVPKVDASFVDPSREIAAIGEQAKIAASVADTFSGPQRAAAVHAKAQGAASAAIADTLSRTQGVNAKIANDANYKNAILKSQADQLNNQTSKKLYDDTMLVDENYDQQVMAANNEITKHLQNAYTNRAYAHNLNTLYDQYNISPSQGGLIHYDKQAGLDMTGETKQTFEEMISAYKDSTGQETLSSDEYQMLYKDYNNQPDPAKKDLTQMQQMMSQMNYPGGRARRGGEFNVNRIKSSGYRLNDWLKQVR